MAVIYWPAGSLALLLTLIIMIPKSTPAPNYLGQYCSNTSTYSAANSGFPTNLKTLLRSLSSHAATNPTGYYSTSVGSGTAEAVYGLFLCRADQNTSGCSDCVATAANDQPQMINCPRTKEGVLWYDECMVRYDSQAVAGTLGQPGTLGEMLIFYNSQNVSGDQEAFTDVLENTMNELTVQAANSPQQTGKKYANKAVNFNRFKKLYSMVQCIPDLTSNDCTQCLKIAINQLGSWQGERVLQLSCVLRYEMYPFLPTFNSSSQPPQQPPLPSPTTNATTGVTPATSPTGNKKVSAGVIIAIVVPVLVMAVTFLVLGSCLFLKRAKKYDVVAGETAEDINLVQSLQYDLRTLEAATNNFSSENILGEGGFGCVYKGKLTNGQEIAVKKLSRKSSQGVQEFKTEVLVVAKLQHRNLVRLLGFCLAGEEKLLVYEYVANKSLDYFLFEPKKQDQLDWRMRYKIIMGIARGMLYLHQDSQLRIIHRDLKVSNILLDENMNPKISDFGMARIFGVDQTQGNTSRVVGTYGYMSPEYAMHGQFSVKSDVYSFGVLMLEIISGQRNSAFSKTGNTNDLFSYGWKQWQDGTPLNFVDPTIRDSCSANEVMRCLHLALSCVQEFVDARPTMATITLALDSHSVTLPTPVQPISFSNVWTEPEFANRGTSDQLSTKLSSRPLWSVNDVSISEIDPR